MFLNILASEISDKTTYIIVTIIVIVSITIIGALLSWNKKD